MLRAIEGFHLDSVGDWVAELRCGHGQHVRHHPPFWSRPWVLSEAGRASRLGLELECPLCDRFELPADAIVFERTAELTATTTPAALLRDHTTKSGVWGKLQVVAGSLQYLVEPPLACELVVDPGHPAIIVPEVRHRMVPSFDARFFIEFYCKPTA
ncbi:MAG: DUF3565 domain-containing protein [Kofleriaceae bacterium]